MKHAQTYMNTCPTADGLQFMPPFGASNPLAVCGVPAEARAPHRHKLYQTRRLKGNHDN